jgi:hypothetical protein
MGMHAKNVGADVKQRKRRRQRQPDANGNEDGESCEREYCRHDPGADDLHALGLLLRLRRKSLLEGLAHQHDVGQLHQQEDRGVHRQWVAATRLDASHAVVNGMSEIAKRLAKLDRASTLVSLVAYPNT